MVTENERSLNIEETASLMGYKQDEFHKIKIHNHENERIR
jgi:hypothetical protein